MALGSEHQPVDAAPAAEPAAEPAGGRLYAVLDVVGLLALAWMLALWQLGTPGVPTLPRLPAFPGFGQLSGRGLLSLALSGLTALLAVAVLITFARPPGRVRRVAAAPVLMALLSLVAWRFVVGFVLVASQGKVSTIGHYGAGYWDGPAVALGLAGAVLLIVRPGRLTRASRLTVTVVVTLSVATSLVIAGMAFIELLGADSGDDLYVTLASVTPGLILALTGAGMAPGWLRGVRQNEPAAAAALLLWGLVITAQQVLPAYLTLILQTGRGMLDLDGAGEWVFGLDALEGLLAVAAAVLIVPVVQDYRARPAAGRHAVLRGPLAVLSVLLIANLAGQLLEYWMLAARDEPEFPGLQGVPGYSGLDGPQPMEQLIVAAGLLGAVLIGLVALRPRPSWTPFALVGAVLLLAVPMLAFLLPEALSPDPYATPRGAIGTVVMPFSLWGGDTYALIFVLPLALLVLLTTGRRRGPG
jgi:hypothetical protein